MKNIIGWAIKTNEGMIFSDGEGYWLAGDEIYLAVFAHRYDAIRAAKRIRRSTAWADIVIRWTQTVPVKMHKEPRP